MRRSTLVSLGVVASLFTPAAGLVQAPPADSTRPKAKVPFAFADFTWLNGNSRQSESVLDSKYFTGEFRLDASYIYDFTHPSDHTLVGTSESGRTAEIQVQQLGIGGDFHAGHARGRFMTQFGMYATMTPRNDASPGREPWIINGWQSYGMFNSTPGLGVQVLWRPSGSLSLLSNDYWGRDALGIPDRMRVHTDNSLLIKYYDRPNQSLTKAAFSLTVDLGCESGGGVSCAKSSPGAPAQYFLGVMLYNRFWFARDRLGLTLGGGAIQNPGRYLVLLPPINGATAFSGTPYFTENPGDRFGAWDASITLDYMPDQFATFRFELDRRAANVPYFAGPGGVTPSVGNTGPAGSQVPGFTPDLRKTESRINLAVLVKL